MPIRFMFLERDGGEIDFDCLWIGNPRDLHTIFLFSREARLAALTY